MDLNVYSMSKFKLLLILLLFTCCTEVMEPNSDNKIIVAHRGGAFLGPENTLGCIERGLETGSDWIEIDVHLSADGKIVVCHDDCVDRTTNGEGVISGMDYNQIRSLKVIDSDGNLTDEYIPLLEEVLDIIRGKAKLLLEIKRTKNSLDGIEQACLECIRSRGMSDDVIVQSFDDDVIERVHSLDPSVRVEKLLHIGLPIFFDFEKYDYVSSFNVCHSFLSDAFINKAHKRGKEVKVWTLNKYNKSLYRKVDGIITNDPQVFISK